MNVVYVCAFLRMLVCMCVGAFVYVFDCVCANVFVLCVCACVCCVCVCPGDELCEVTNTTSNYHKLLDDSAANTVAVDPTTETFSLIPPPANSPGRSSRVMIYCNRTLLFPLHPPPPDSVHTPCLSVRLIPFAPFWRQQGPASCSEWTVGG